MRQKTHKTHKKRFILRLFQHLYYSCFYFYFSCFYSVYSCFFLVLFRYIRLFYEISLRLKRIEAKKRWNFCISGHYDFIYPSWFFSHLDVRFFFFLCKTHSLKKLLSYFQWCDLACTTLVLQENYLLLLCCFFNNWFKCTYWAQSHT